MSSKLLFLTSSLALTAKLATAQTPLWEVNFWKDQNCDPNNVYATLDIWEGVPHCTKSDIAWPDLPQDSNGYYEAYVSGSNLDAGCEVGFYHNNPQASSDSCGDLFATMDNSVGCQKFSFNSPVGLAFCCGSGDCSSFSGQKKRDVKDVAAIKRTSPFANKRGDADSVEPISWANTTIKTTPTPCPPVNASTPTPPAWSLTSKNTTSTSAKHTPTPSPLTDEHKPSPAPLKNATATASAIPLPSVNATWSGWNNTKRADCKYNPTKEPYSDAGLLQRVTDTLSCPGGSTSCSLAEAVTLASSSSNTFGATVSEGVSFFEIVQASVSFNYQYQFSDTKTTGATYTVTIDPGTSGYLTFTPDLQCTDGSFSGSCDWTTGQSGTSCIPLYVGGGSSGTPQGTYDFVQQL